jgi:hypothetical protein
VTTTVANLRDGWPANGAYVGRAGHGLDGYFGNPYRLIRDVTREQVLYAYAAYFARRMATDPEFRGRVEMLRDKVLVCFCSPLPCHADVIAEWLNR